MTLAFTLRKLLAPFLFPLSIALELLVISVVLLWFTRYQRLGKAIATAAMLLLLLMSLDGPSSWVLEPLERQYPAPVEQERAIGAHPPRWIVVLGGGFTPDRTLPVTSQLGSSALARLIEGVRLYKRFPGTKLILSGGSWYGTGPEADVMAAAARLLGAEPSDLIREAASVDTEDQARLVAPIVGKDPFLLVTAASHIPRSMALFQKRGLHPIAAPADYDIKRSGAERFSSFQPKAANVSRVEEAAYEYLGLAWARLRGAI